MSGDYKRWLENELAMALTLDRPTCSTCNDTGMVLCVETNPEDGAYEMACPCGHEPEGREIALDPAGEDPF